MIEGALFLNLSDDLRIDHISATVIALVVHVVSMQVVSWRELRKQGLSHYAIADALGISRPTVRRFLAAEQFPERLSGPKRERQSLVAPYVPFLRERGPAGCHNGGQLFREAKARG
jgi:hypothetical protein